jgi:hypothetical protein
MKALGLHYESHYVFEAGHLTLRVLLSEFILGKLGISVVLIFLGVIKIIVNVGRIIALIREPAPSFVCSFFHTSFL